MKRLKERDLVGLLFAGMVIFVMTLIAQPAGSYWLNLKILLLILSGALVLASSAALFVLRKRRDRDRLQ